MEILVNFYFVSACFLGLQLAFSQETGKKAIGEKTATQEKTAKKDGDKNDRFPDGHDHDFGKVAMGTYAKHTFRIVNTWDSPIKVTRISSGASTVRAYVDKHELQPKEVGKLILILNTSNFVGSKTVSVYLTMQYGNGTVQEFRFLMHCNSDPDQKLAPKVTLQIRLMQAACKGVFVARDGLPPPPGGYLDLGDPKSPDIITVLKEGADVNMPDQMGKTALMYAASWGLVNNVRTLLAHGANAHLKTDDGWTALMFSEAEHPFRVEERREVAKVLKEHLAKKR